MFYSVFMQGGILGIIIDWSCDLDWWVRKKCYPEYSFRRLDSRDSINNVAPGYNFRWNHFKQTLINKQIKQKMFRYLKKTLLLGLQSTSRPQVEKKLEP